MSVQKETVVATEEPIQCSLSATELPERLAEIRAVGDTSLRSAEEGDSRALLRFAADSHTREQLRAIVTAEYRCCAFLDLDLAETPDALVLSIDAPAGGELVMHELVTAFRGRGRVGA